MGDAANRQWQQAHSIHGGIARASPQSNFEQSNQCSVPHTLTKETHKTQNHQRNQHYSHSKISVNEVSVVLSFRASPNAFAPSAPIPLSTDTPEWRDPNTNSAKQLQWATRPTGNGNKRTRYMGVLIVSLRNPL
jgi:hypothetical protein